MGKYIKEFNDHTEYEEFVDQADFDLQTPNISLCNRQNEVHYSPYIHNYYYDYLTFKPLEDGTFSFSNSINYSIDNGQTWVNLASNTATPTISADSKIMWKASGLTPTSAVGIGTFSSTGKFDVEGNVMSLVGGDNFAETTTMSNYQFMLLFNHCTNLVSAKHLILPAITLAQNCYNSMFYGCTSLTTAPELPATTLANSCYYGMFLYCTGLITAPELPATTLANNCYQAMFNSCTSLTTAPTLPATTLASSCYNSMFYNCTGLITAPELPAMTLAANCYSNMFYGCTNLQYIKALFITSPNIQYTYNWVQGVASTGTFVKNSAATWTATGDNGVPTGWTVQTANS